MSNEDLENLEVTRTQNYRLYTVPTLEVRNVPKSVTGNVPNYRLGNAQS